VKFSSRITVILKISKKCWKKMSEIYPNKLLDNILKCLKFLFYKKSEDWISIFLREFSWNFGSHIWSDKYRNWIYK
jgi:hypothetical protein